MAAPGKEYAPCEPTCVTAVMIGEAAAVAPPEGCFAVHAGSTCKQPDVLDITHDRPSVTEHPHATLPVLTGGH
jgi:hypothetical protein